MKLSHGPRVLQLDVVNGRLAACDQCNEGLDILRIGVVVGLVTEARIARRLGWAVAIGGGTAFGATAAASSLIERGCTALISFGLAGGLDPNLRPGTVIVPSMVIVGNENHATDSSLSRRLGGPQPYIMLGADAVVAGIAEKHSLYSQTSASAVDLESGAVARAAAVYGMPFAVLRAICDPADRALPPAALVSLNANGTIDLWRVLASIATQPAQLPALLSLAFDAAEAKRALATRVTRIALAQG